MRLGKRYANPQPADRSGLDRAYAAAMREVWRNFPQDPDAGALFAEAMMDLRPWDQWTPEGKPQPGTDEIIATLDAVLKLNPDHPLTKPSLHSRGRSVAESGAGDRRRGQASQFTTRSGS